MADRYRLLKDLPGLPEGTVLKRIPDTNTVVDDSAMFKFGPQTIKMSEWFEPVEDRWKPKHRERYWHIDAEDLSVADYTWTGDCIDNSLYNSYNCFSTEALAELAADKVRECLMQFHRDQSQSKLVP